MTLVEWDGCVDRGTLGATYDRGLGLWFRRTVGRIRWDIEPKVPFRQANEHLPDRWSSFVCIESPAGHVFTVSLISPGRLTSPYGLARELTHAMLGFEQHGEAI